jgi:hypothetical protein
MRRSSKAALLSGLIFPGVGHMFLKRYQRGSILMILALLALSAIVARALERAQSIMDRINSGEIPLDPAAITDMVTTANSGADSLIENAALIALLGCWLIGIVDSYRLGAAQEKLDKHTPVLPT